MKKTARVTKTPKPALPAIQAEARIKQVEARIEQVKAREEQAKAREEQAKAQVEQAKALAEQAKARAVQAEHTLQKVLEKETALPTAPAARLLKPAAGNAQASGSNPLEQLTERQREILRLIAEGQNTKQIAELLGVSPKTVEYHRMKLMAGLNLHDIPGLVRFAVKVGLITPDN